jgi:hypothetical protein
MSRLHTSVMKAAERSSAIYSNNARDEIHMVKAYPKN